MSHPRLFYCPLARPHATVDLPDDEARHALRVLRLRAGDAVRLFDGAGFFYEAELASAGRGALSARVGERFLSEAEPRTRLVLLAALLKGKKADFLIQKAVEVGVGELWFFEARRSVAQVPLFPAEDDGGDEPDSARVERWGKIVVSACKQCGRAGLMPVRLLPDLEAALKVPLAVQNKFVFCAAGEGAAGEAAGLGENAGAGPGGRAAGASGESFDPAGGAAALIGPEGGLESNEIALAIRHGFRPRSLGPRVLRAETAALTAAVLLLYRAGELGV